MTSFHHIPVLADIAIASLQIQPQGRYLDATVGGGGHSQLILAADPTTRLVALDQDQVALAAARERLSGYGDRVEFHHCNFGAYSPQGVFDGILADIGVSSPQVDDPERGFSFRQAAPLDMRMDQTQAQTAADIVNHEDETTLANLIYQYGEERLSRRIARQIVQQRPFTETTQLAEAIARSVPRSYRYGRIHPATRTFQALRIAVNRELDQLEQFLQQAPGWLRPGGRLTIISFHSLEDRMVKHSFKGNPELTVITKKPAIADDAEVSQNPRARSAKLRTAERRTGEELSSERRSANR
ncbi:MAG: 16S rRNA (cytosine(1402)-N(4))-methyltransferase RsmH [Elainellaceae cyanobacterium]